MKMEEVKETIDIDKIDMSNNLIFIEEHHNADANFVLHAIISHCMDKNYGICFVLFHNSFFHLHNVGMKLGYNLMEQCKSNISIVRPLHIIDKNIQNENNRRWKFKVIEFNIKQMVQLIKCEYTSIKKKIDSQKVYIIIDDISHLFDIGLNIEDVWLFIRYIRSFINSEPFLTICIASHIYKNVEELCEPTVIANGLRHFAELIISIQPLEKGCSKNVSGKIIIYWKSQNGKLSIKHPEEMLYLFKLFDRKVKLFAPGSVLAM